MTIFRAGRASPALAVTFAVSLFIGVAGNTPAVHAADAFSTIVDEHGRISLPDGDFRRDWTFLGAFAVNDPEKEGANSIHNVYTEKSTVDYYREHGTFPDGAILVKEPRNTETGDLTTGTVSWASDIAGWFVMVKDEKGRFPDNPLWGEGWGWAFFEAGNPEKTVTKNYVDDCLGCHTPARDTDWIYVEGYPVLKPFGSEAGDAAGAVPTMGGN